MSHKHALQACVMACGISTPHEHVQYADLPGVPYSTPCKHASPSCLASCLICIQCLTCMPYNLSSKHAAPARLAALLISMPPMRVPPARLVACPVSLLHRHASYRALLSVAYQPALWLSPSRTPSTPLSSLSVYIYISLVRSCIVVIVACVLHSVRQYHFTSLPSSSPVKPRTC